MVDEPGVTRDRLYGRSFWGNNEFMVVDTGGVITMSKSQEDLMDDLAITTTIGMDGIPLASREAAVARMPSMIERQAATAVEEASFIIFLVDGQVCVLKYYPKLCLLFFPLFFHYILQFHGTMKILRTVRFFFNFQLNLYILNECLKQLTGTIYIFDYLLFNLSVWKL